MRQSKSRNKGEAAKLEMTPMIDVVFQLLIFFLVTMKQEDILSQLQVSRPAPDDTPPPAVVDELLTITVYEEGYVLKGRRVSLQHLDSQLSRLAGFSTKISVVIKCTGGSPHANLVKLLDICSKSGLTNLSVFSM
jgi:biopolymer transport protein ExbD